MNSSKTFISFTYNQNSTNLMKGLATACKDLWSPLTNELEVINYLERVL